MKKILFIFLLFSMFISAFAQLDREHWFAPMVDRTGNGNPFQNLYLSTNRTTPFPVSIYNNNVLIGTVTISKGNPQKFNVLRSYIITTLQADLFTQTTKGLYVKADFPFYANLRFSVYNHAEIITSKGISSTGNKFYAAMTPITVSNSILNFMTSVLATQDNTTVTISGYAPLVQFSNGTTGATNPTMTFTLNKGQSYIIDGSGSSNTDGFIGAKIVSDKPINITNGNFNGQYAGNNPNSSDILMDQSVPVPLLGSDFALVKGNGAIGTNMEGAIVIATEDNTQIFVNNEVLPIATINEGKYFVIPDTKYILNGINHYNLFIKTTKNAYVYQILAGEPVGGVATGGFNFIPALNCYLPKQIDEIGLIDENYVFSAGNPSGILNIPTKLNLITETGAAVTVNGVTPPISTGPFLMTGTANWVTYGIPNVTGNITVQSSKAITAGITAGSDAVGYGGFFAGFPTTPVILASGGICSPGIILTVDPIIYETYQWYQNGVLIPGATSSSYSPTSSGYYTASVTMGTCLPLVSAQYKVLNCTKQSTATYNVCSTQTIIPTFSSSSQTPVPSTVAITSSPTLGTATVNATTGAITYTATNPGTAGTDIFVYTFCGNNVDFPDCETVTVTINFGTKLPLLITTSTQTICDTDLDGIQQVNLSTYINNYTLDPLVTATYFQTLSNAQNNIGALANPVSATGTQTFYIRFEKIGSCPNYAPITIIIKTPKKSDILTNQVVCTGNLTTLDAGPGFSAYLWNTGATTSSITNIPVGSYWVDLTFNGCIYRQYVNVTEANLPTITTIDINGNTVTITASGGYPPYEYSLNGNDWQTSNVFYNLPRGAHTVYVRDSKMCVVVKKDFSIINLINTITPNGDGYNDEINYSDLLLKSEPLFRIFDRYGTEVFYGTPSNRFTWDGSIGGRPVPTATYWYLLQWKEFGTNTPVKYTSWLLVKHRDNDYFKK